MSNNFSQLFPTDLYHSYVVEGNKDKVTYLIREFLEERGDIEKRSGDMLFQLYDAFSIEDSKEIKEWHKNKPIGNGKKICIIGVDFINHAAEQSLLKIIEEPNIDTHFFIVVPDSSLLAPTILSRVHLIRNIENDTQEEDKIAQDFLKLSILLRIEYIKNTIKEFEDKQNSGGLRYRAITLVNGIEKIIYKKWKKDLNNKDLKFILDEIKNCRGYLSTPGASVKMILEHMALISD